MLSSRTPPGLGAETRPRDMTNPRQLFRNIVAKGTLALAGAVAGVLVVAVVAIRQWNDPPIAIQPFIIVPGIHTAGLSPVALADQTKAYILTIYSYSNDLFESAYSAEDDRLFRRNVTGDSAASALLLFSTRVGHDQSRFLDFG